MGDPKWAYIVDEPRIVHETIDGEVLAIDNDTGTYFSIEGSGVVVWESLAAGTSRSRLLGFVCATYETDPDEVSAGVDDFVARLVKLDILRPFSGDTNSMPAGIDANGEGPFVAPIVNVYTDLQDLLLFDPIHEVDEAGWPHRPI